MPLTPTYSWAQDDATATISISLPSSAAASRNTRVECTEAAVKLTCPPYFLQLDLFGDVDDGKSKATIDNRSVEVVVYKKSPGQWPGLKTTLPPDEAKSRRAAAVADKERRDAAALADKREKKRQDDDYVFHKQWDLEKDEKRTIERLAAEHKREAERELYRWADDAEGRAAPEGEEELVTYFDKQLVEGGELEVKDGVVPLPGTYHRKTKRSDIVASALSEAPRRNFDIRAGGGGEGEGGQGGGGASVEVAEEGGEGERLAEAEREREAEEERFREQRREQEFQKEAKLSEAREKNAEEAAKAKREKEEAEAERRRVAAEEEEKWRETQRRKIREYEEKKAAKEARAARRAARGEVKKDRKKVKKQAREGGSDESDGGGTSSSSSSSDSEGEGGGAAGGEAEERRMEEALKEEGAKPLGKMGQTSEQEARNKEVADELRKGRTGISINRFECERVAAEQRTIADAYFKAGFVAEAKAHEQKARDAAPWVEDRREYETPEEAEGRREAEEARRAEEEARRGALADVPAPRQSAKVELNFSKGKRSMPARERLETDEEVALREAEDIRQKKLANPDAKGPAEDQGLWLKQRGDHFYRTRDYRAAVNAYSSCVDLDKRNALAFSNRALCHLRLGAFADCIADANSAYDLLKRVKLEGKDEEERGQAMQQRARCLLRRGIAHVRLGMTDQALADVDAACKHAEGNEELKDDLEELRRAVASNQASRLKGEGDALFKGGDLKGAVDAYTRALQEDEGMYQVWSNRAACHLSMEDYPSCVEDCTRALNLVDPAQARQSRLCLRILVRRGTAHCWAGDFPRGREDLKRALLIDTSNRQLRDDLGMLVTTTGAASSLQEFMEGKLPDPKQAAMAALQAAGVQGP